MKRKNEVIVGVFVTAAVIIGIVGTLWLARRGFSKSYPLYARFDWGNNLKQGQPVLLAGVQVGYVDKVDLNPAGFLEVTLSIDKKWKVPEGSTATVQNEGFFGDKSVAIHPCRRPVPTLGPESATAGGQSTKEPPPVPGGDYAPAVCRPNAFYPPGDTLPTGKPAPTMDEILGRVDSMSTSLSDVVQTVRIEMVQRGGIEDLHKTIASTNALVQELNRVAAEQSRGLTLTLATLRRTASALDSASLDSTVRNLQTTTGNLAALTGNLQTTTQRLDQVMTKVETGDGTVGKLLNDPGVYNELRQLLSRLDTLTADIKKNPKRYINVKVF